MGLLVFILIFVLLPAGAFQGPPQRRSSSASTVSRQKIALGRTLFFDKRLSLDGTVSCASCHDPAFAFTDSKVIATGVGNKPGVRNTPTILNSAFSESFFWDGRASSLEEQVKHPLLSSFEMGMPADELTQRLSSIPEYRRQFGQVFKSEGITLDTIAKAIAAYERTLLSGNSPFDRFITGNDQAITSAQRRGWELFKGKAKCIECHKHSQESPLFTDFKFHNTGVAATDTLFDKLLAGIAKFPTDTTVSAMVHSDGFSELGRFSLTRQQADIGAFKTPTLRDVELTSPYMHNGSLKTLIDVVQFYNRGGIANSYLDKLMQPLNLNDNEVNDLVEFMRALTSDDVLKTCQTTHPQTRAAVPLEYTRQSSNVDPKAHHLVYLHGRIVEEGRRPESPQFGFYEYDKILEAFRARGFVVISEQRPKGTQIEKYAEKVAEQIRGLLKAGVPPRQITVVGASQGSWIAMLASTYLKNRDLKFVFIAGCSADDEFLKLVDWHGNVLSIYERTDQARTCEKYRADATGVGKYEEIELQTGLRHGFIYRPMIEWIEPTVAWAKK